jgi:predicted Zn-ribbon and HTH transcriptional regulator
MRDRVNQRRAAMAQTVRQMIIDILLEGPATAKELSARVRIPEKDVLPHLAHIRKSLHHGQQRLVMDPACCRACGFVFQKRERLREFVGDRNPREHEFALQLRAFDTPKSGQSLGVAALLALCSALIGKSLEGGLVVVGGLNLGGSIDPLSHAVGVVEHAIEKGAAVVLIPVSARKQLFELSDDMAAKVNVLFYTDARDAFIKAIAD